MGGTIGFESAEQQGTRFWVELPFAPVATADVPRPRRRKGRRSRATAGAARRDTAPAKTSSPSPIRSCAIARGCGACSVLVADDNAANRMVVQRLLQKAGHRPVCVEGGEKVLDLLAAADYDAVIVDLHMPGISGLDLLKQLRVMEAGGGRARRCSCSAPTSRPMRSRPASALAPGRSSPSRSRRRACWTRWPTSRPMGRSAGRSRTFAAPRYAGEDVFDSTVLDELSALGLGNNFEREFIAQCMRDADACIEALTDAGRQADWESVREQAHALKGVAGNLGLVKLAAVAGELMRLAERQVADEWPTRAAWPGRAPGGRQEDPGRPPAFAHRGRRRRTLALSRILGRLHAGATDLRTYQPVHRAQ